MCMTVEYHLYLLRLFYYVNDYNFFIIFVFMFMGGSMSAVMLLLCYLPNPNDHDYYNISSNCQRSVMPDYSQGPLLFLPVVDNLLQTAM